MNIIINYNKVVTARVSGALTAVVMTVVHFLLDAPVAIASFGYYQLYATDQTSLAYIQWFMFFMFFLSLTGFGALPSFWIYFVRIPAFRSYIFCRSSARRSIASDGASSQMAVE